MTEFHRSSSLPAGPSPKCEAKEKAVAAYHVRSTSLPCRLHPLISQLEDEISSTRAWQSQQATCSSSSSSLRAGLSRMEFLHGALDEFLRLHQTQESLYSCRSSMWAERLLDDFLCLADAYGSFREALVSLQQIQSGAQAAIRRRNTSELASHSKALRKAGKEIAKLGSALQDLTTSAGKTLDVAGPADADLVGIMKEVKIVIASASAAIFSGLVVISASSFSWGQSSWTSVLKKKLKSSKEMGEGEWEIKLAALKELEKSIAYLEEGSERVFKCLIKTRVSLLNILTP